MLFDNDQVNSDDLPQVESLQFIPLEKNYLNVSLVAAGIFWLIVLIALSILFLFRGSEFHPILKWAIPSGVITIGLLNFLLVIKGFYQKAYAIRQRDIIYRTGLIWQKEIAVPFKRVQHCEVNQGPIERMFELSNLNVFTAGGSSSDLSIPGLRPQTAQQLKEFIVKKSIADEEE